MIAPFPSTVESGRCRKELEDLVRDSRGNLESFRDYRVWMQEQGHEIEGLGGVEAAESMVKRLAYRLKNRGSKLAHRRCGKDALQPGAWCNAWRGP